MTYFIAEVSSNHNADLARCKTFIQTAAKIGCDAVKFQLFKIDQLFAPEILQKSAEHRARSDWELSADFLPALSQECRDNNIDFGCTPFDLNAVAQMQPYVDFYKIASYELTWDALLIACAQTGKPVILSTGMATLEEITRAANVLQQAGCQHMQLLHCVSQYPTPPADANLAFIDTLRQASGQRIGWSDHSRSPGVVQRAIHRWGAESIEFHLDLDGQGAEYKSGHCWLPEEAAALIQMTRDAMLADGQSEKVFTAKESAERLWRADPEDGLRPFKQIRQQT